jgi:hypothetical protein
VTALDIAMESVCTTQNLTWDRNKGPWSFGARSFHSTPPSPNTPDWFRAYMFCIQVNTWCGVLAEEIEPDLDWRVLIAKDGYHATACGFADGKPELICDLVWDWDTDEPESAEQIFNKVVNRGPPKVLTVNEAIETLSSGVKKFKSIKRLMRLPAYRPTLLKMAESDPGFKKFLSSYGIHK